jgi:hypothetical protein
MIARQINNRRFFARSVRPSRPRLVARRIVALLVLALALPAAPLATPVYAADSTFDLTVAINPSGDTTVSVAIGDFNSDGVLDLVLANADHASQVYLNTGRGDFAPPINLPSGVNQPVSVAAGDFDGDGTLDLVLGSRDQPSQVYLNDGTAHFNPTATPLGVSNGIGLAVGDFDGDSRLDILLGNQVYLNQGQGSFAPTSAPLAAYGSHCDAVADFDGDGKLDIVSNNQVVESYVIGSPSLSVIEAENRASRFRPTASVCRARNQLHGK